MKILFDKDKMIEEINRIGYRYEDYNQSYECDEDETISEDEFKKRIKDALNFVNSLTEDKLQSAIKGLNLKKNGKPKKNSIAHLFVFDVGFWFVEWYLTFSTYRIVARAIDEDTMDISLESSNINTGEFPYITKL